MTTFFKRLLQVIENQGFKNLNDFALNGLNYDSSSKLNRLKKENTSPSVDILLDISNKFQEINLHWLITGKGEMLLNSVPNLVSEPKELYNGSENELIASKNKIIALLEEQKKQLEEENRILREKNKNSA